MQFHANSCKIIERQKEWYHDDGRCAKEHASGPTEDPGRQGRRWCDGADDAWAAKIFSQQESMVHLNQKGPSLMISSSRPRPEINQTTWVFSTAFFFKINCRLHLMLLA